MNGNWLDGAPLLPLKTALALAGQRWQCFCGCSLTCDVCREILEGLIRDEVSHGDFFAHHYLHRPLPLTPVADDGRRVRAEQHEDDPTPMDTVRLMTMRLGYRLARGFAMKYDG